MSKVITKNKILNILDSQGKSYIKMYDFRGNLLWNKDQGGGGEWVLQESDYIVGTDGKYYQKWLDISKVVDNNPVPDLNDQWVEDTVSGDLNIDSNFDYYMSNSNHFIDNSYSQFKVQWSGLTSITFLYRSYAESSYDYLVINGLDRPAFTDIPSDTTSDILAHTKGNQTETYNNITVECDEGEHFIWFAYRKDSSASSFSDRAFVGIPNNLKNIPEGSVKKGPELRYEYIKSGEVEITRPGYGRFKYYKHYYTPDESKDLITTDYYLGEEEPLTPITRNYLRFDATDGDLHIGVNNLSYFTNLEYSIDFDEGWMNFQSKGVDVPNGHSLYLRADGTLSGGDDRTFTTSETCECHGNVMSLLSKDNFETLKTCPEFRFAGLFRYSKIKTAPELPATTLNNYCYMMMFNSCDSLVNAPELPATTLGYYCYGSMFQNCHSLVNAPELPATTLADNCYQSMFSSCTSLVNAPELPATTLRDYCYQSMFHSCTSLVNAPELPATTLGYYCYGDMFYNCNSLVNAPELPATTLADNCYYQMFANCHSLVNAPELPATTLKYSCYSSMFHTCISLVNAPELPATTLADSCYSNMFTVCYSLVNAPELPATTLASGCYSGMFSSCTSLVNAPELQATTLADYCYQQMFYNCNSLVNAPELPATTLASGCYSSMFNSCYSLVNVPELPATTLASGCYQSMFQDCYSLVNAPELQATTLASNCYSYMFYGSSKINNIKCNIRYNTDGTEITDKISLGWLWNASSIGTFYKNPDWAGPTVRNNDTIPDSWTIEDWVQ